MFVPPHTFGFVAGTGTVVIGAVEPDISDHHAVEQDTDKCSCNHVVSSKEQPLASVAKVQQFLEFVAELVVLDELCELVEAVEMHGHVGPRREVERFAVVELD